MDLLVSKTDILIFYANAFDSRGEDGSTINGCTVHYMFWGENGTALVGQSEPDVKKPIGMQRGKSWVDYDIRNKIRIAPAIYEGTFRMDVDSKGKPVLKLVDVAYKSNVRMQAYRVNGLVIPGMLEDTEGTPGTASDPVTSVTEEPVQDFRDIPEEEPGTAENSDTPGDSDAAENNTPVSGAHHGRDGKKSGRQS